MQPMQENIFGKNPEIPQIKHITGPEKRAIIKTTASDIGIFSGKEKFRLELSNNELDPTHKFAIALFEDNEVRDDQENETWVYVNGPGNVRVKADISSIAKRLDLAGLKGGKAEVIRLAKDNELENKIQELVKAYESTLIEVKGFVAELKNLTKDISNFEENLPQGVLIRFGKGIKLKDDESENAKDKELRNLIKSFCEDVNLLFGKEAFLGDTILDFVTKLNDFQAKLSKLDSNFNPNVAAPREKITKDTTLWEKSKPNLLFNTTAKNVKDYPDYNTYNKGSGKAVRLNIALHDDKNKEYAIKTDGYIYHEKPKASEKFIPYSEDDKTWVLLNINSLSDRTGISVSDLQSPDKINNLKVVLQNKMQEIIKD